VAIQRLIKNYGEVDLPKMLILISII